MKQPMLKYCGHRSFDDYKRSVELGIEFIGIIFANSKRQVTAEAVANWQQNKPLRDTQKLVGVFVDEQVDYVIDIANVAKLDIIQCHGKENIVTLEKLKSQLSCSVWKTIHHGPDVCNEMKRYEGIVDAFLIDTSVKGMVGGTGVTFDWQYVPTYQNQAHELGVPCFIAGGVRPENVEQLLAYQPDGIDVSSGIETNEEKDEEKMIEVKEKVKSDDSLS
ncbi:phosphoribosylanthranilate isomerase [Texcoconibacillus texcoconensis]|uniref:N-(5'-phosphoribosyl)anthranilate isomerase n=1 Tax=Texcoconibacillus texcoconensis TaxID=1095777 RepID=A0A840QNG9_9BACI|nr:phosphoribosylanthranilate isomerase [Texcoconibacillus texcoconensis]MBB5172883.1 phosphoribosylanthranilate isomerase [Texcoconibacillus texcoconensis]